MPPEPRLLHRRAVFAVMAAAAPALAWSAPLARGGAEQALAELERRTGGRLGVAAQDTGSGRRIGHRADERFPMCSTFKMTVVAAVLARVDRNRERLDRFVRYGPADLLEYAPAARAHLHRGGMSVSELCEAAVTLSDNTAANLLVASLGGPAAVTAYARSLGDPVFRLDRVEPALNVSRPGDPRDTTIPSATVSDMRLLLLGGALSPTSRGRLLGWMRANKTGDARLRAGVPKGWVVADKTGTWSGQGTANDIGLLQPPAGAPILVAVYFTGSSIAATARDAVIAQAARIVASSFRPVHG